MIAVLVASAVNGAILLLSFPISNLFGKRGLIASERLTGMLLVLMSVNMVMNGVAEFIKQITTYNGDYDEKVALIYFSFPACCRLGADKA